MKAINTTRLLTILLVIIQLFSLVVPVTAEEALLEQRFNLEYVGVRGYQILELIYENAAINPSFSDLADRAIELKTTYSTKEAISILTETKSIVKKITKADYKKYGEDFENNILVGSGTMTTKFTYDSFIMRNVLYAMIKSKASYNDIMKAIQLIYDTAVIQTEKEAFRSDALEVLSDLKILASYTGDKNISDMLQYVSNFASGTHGNYSGDKPIKSVDVSDKYDEYLQEEYDRVHGGGEIEDDTETNRPEYDSGGNQPTDELKPPPETIPGDNTGNGTGTGGNTGGGFMDNDNFMDDIGGMLDGSGVGNYVLCYTTDKTANKVEYHKTKITTRQYVTYENIISVLTTASRNSDLMFIEDTNAILVVYDGISCVIEKSDTLYGEAEITKLFECFNEFGLALVKIEDLEKEN